ncbi:MAG: ABC transporter six-transmembrane domain-containing protein [Pseudomonadota bacterium]
MIKLTDRISLGLLLPAFWWRVTIKWSLMLNETAFFAIMPLLLNLTIDGLLADDWTSFGYLVTALAVLLIVATGRRIYDTRDYCTMRVELGKAQVARSENDTESVSNARVLLGREMIYFLGRNRAGGSDGPCPCRNCHCRASVLPWYARDDDHECPDCDAVDLWALRAPVL